MGAFVQVDTCLITGLPAQNVMSDLDAIEYFVTVGGKRYFMLFEPYASQWKEDDFFQKNKNLLQAFLYNGKWFDDPKTYINIEELKKLVENTDYPKTPKQKLENLFLDFYNRQQEEGEVIPIKNVDYDQLLWKVLYFKSVNELSYYVEYLEEQGVIEAEFNRTKDRSGLLENYKITFEGLDWAINLQEEGEQSDKCFIAMSFKPETKEIREAIKTAIKNTGFTPILIDEQNIDSDKTINDEIIANLKKCKFCIADFSFHSNGVYFESGFALGQGKKVIYTCQKEEFGKAHFDIKPLQHIIYESPEQLTKDLSNKIEAWVK